MRGLSGVVTGQSTLKILAAIRYQVKVGFVHLRKANRQQQFFADRFAVPDHLSIVYELLLGRKNTEF